MCKYVHRSVNLVLEKDWDCELQRKQSLVKHEDEWEMAAQGFEAQVVKPKTRLLQPRPLPEGNLSTSELVGLFRVFLATQQKRDDFLQEDLWSLQIALEASQQFLQPLSAGQSATADEGSPRLDLPTPGPRRADQHGPINAFIPG